MELTPGKGTVDFVKLREALERVGYAGAVQFDLEYRVDDLEFIEGEYDAAIKYLKECGWGFTAAAK